MACSKTQSTLSIQRVVSTPLTTLSQTMEKLFPSHNFLEKGFEVQSLLLSLPQTLSILKALPMILTPPPAVSLELPQCPPWANLLKSQSPGVVMTLYILTFANVDLDFV